MTDLILAHISRLKGSLEEFEKHLARYESINDLVGSACNAELARFVERLEKHKRLVARVATYKQRLPERNPPTSDFAGSTLKRGRCPSAE